MCYTIKDEMEKDEKKMDIQKLSEETGCNLQAALGRLNGMEALYGRLLN